MRHLLNARSGYPLGASVADMDGWLPIDYVLANPNARLDSTVRSLKMLLHVNADAVALTVHKSELDEEEGGAQLLVSKQCPGYNWHRLAEGYTNPITKAAGKMMQAVPVGYGHDGRGAGAMVDDSVASRIIRADLTDKSSQSVYVKVFFHEWKQVFLRRLGINGDPASLKIKEDKQRAFGRTGALIKELNDVTDRIYSRCIKMATQDKETKHLLKWFDMSGIGEDDCTTLRYALYLEEETWTPVQKLRRVINDSRNLLLYGRPGLYYNIPPDAMLSMERQPLHTLAQNESKVAPDMIDILLQGPSRQNLRTAVRVLDGLKLCDI